ncbi:MAG TPA: BON domain-containing protein [Verrucomicrobiae bacterium]|nr:BON domain-containing protein [Verrucomicrobiae bacterium]
MKRERLTIRFLVLFLSIFGVTIFVAGCAGDRYTRNAGEYINDESLDARVTTALNESPEYKLNSVTVQSFRGVVQLSGFVNTPDQRSKAGEIARQVPGVKGVENNITIKSS